MKHKNTAFEPEKIKTSKNFKIQKIVLGILVLSFAIGLIQLNRYQPLRKENYVLRPNEVIFFPTNEWDSNLVIETNSSSINLFKSNKTTLYFSHFINYSIISPLNNEGILNYNYYFNAGSKIEYRVSDNYFGQFGYDFTISKLELDPKNKEELRTRVFYDNIMESSILTYVFEESGQYLIQLGYMTSPLNDYSRHHFNLEINSLQYLLPDPENEVPDPINNQISLQADQFVQYYILNSGNETIEISTNITQNNRIFLSYFLWIDVIIVLITLGFTKFQYTKRQFAEMNKKLVKLNAIFQLKNPESLSDLRASFKELNQEKESASTYLKEWPFIQNFNKNMLSLEKELNKEIANYVNFLENETFMANIDKVQILAKLLDHPNREFIYFLMDYFQDESKIIRIIHNFASKFNHIHILELANESKIAIGKIEKYVPLLIKRKQIEAQYDSINKSLNFDWQVEEEMENLTDLFENWDNSKIKKN